MCQNDIFYKTADENALTCIKLYSKIMNCIYTVYHKSLAPSLGLFSTQLIILKSSSKWMIRNGWNFPCKLGLGGPLFFSLLALHVAGMN